MKGGKMGKVDRITKSNRADLNFPVARMLTMLRRGAYSHRYSD